MNQSDGNGSMAARDDDDQNVCRVAAWNSKEEFALVYQLIFGHSTNDASKRQACEYLRMWKIRRQYQTPASVLSTLTILEVLLQDDFRVDANAADAAIDSQALAARQHTLRQLYAHAFTRFLNYMSSILQTRHLKTMYTTAHELGLDAFLVDLRHLCAHGHDLPALDVFQRATQHLLEWLHTFYWQRELEHIADALVCDVRPGRAVHFAELAASLLHVYDTATEALHRRCRFTSDIRGGQPFDEAQAMSLKKYGIYYKLDRLPAIVSRVTNELTEVAARESRVRGHAQIFCSQLLACRYFMETPAQQSKQQRAANDVIGLHQNLFRTLAINGFIETCFDGLVAICEDDHETLARRRGAQFWAEHIAGGFVLFRAVKRAFKARKERNAEFELDLAPLNTDGMTKDIRAVYGRLGVNCADVLIFGDTIRRPWTLTFSRRYMQERLAAVNEFTAPVLVKCMGLVEPALSELESAHLRGLIAVYVEEDGKAASADVTDPYPAEHGVDGTDTQLQSGEELNGDTHTGEVAAAEPLIVNGSGVARHTPEDSGTLEVHVVEQLIEEPLVASMVVDESGEQSFGLWSEVSDDYNWKVVPLGRVPWE